MEVYLNEISIEPICISIDESKKKIFFLLEVMKFLREHNIKILRVHEHFYIENLGGDYSINDFLNDQSVPIDIRILLQSIVAYPVIKEENDKEMDSYIHNIFEVVDHKRQLKSSEGVAAGYLFNSPVLSLSTHEYWSDDEISLKITYHQGDELTCKVINLGYHNYNSNQLLLNYLEIVNGIPAIFDEASIYNIFPIERYFFEKPAIDDILSWVRDDIRYISRIIALIEDIPLHPFSGGLGKTEILKYNWNGKCSKRIVKKDRVIYTYTDAKITIHRCREHY
ncbi:Txe/YoeB family addiction module toxin [Sphingobacterium prati]|uniref:Txe/YoeB family addiction module toxin n=1 Tax=Sphingobacterium prati TaxID=2737006 RepID=UPI0015567505|nr:Txe/YoeB family addiction module toxin [Sphingobacterium prati]NPE46250.1 Txe/YoeB family addiction module toxin [Sphingobacterium prati]